MLYASRASPEWPNLVLPFPFDEHGPRTRVSAVIGGRVSGAIDAGTVFGHCAEVSVAVWTAPGKPISVLQCGWAGDFRNVAVLRVGQSLVVQVHLIEENGPDATTVETVGAPVKLPR